MYRYFIQLSYVGTHYNGWQVQDNTPHTIQQLVNEALSKILNEEIKVLGCGRTDTGVHATEYYAHFDSKYEGLEKDPKWIYKLNAVTPFDIAIQKIISVASTANARFDAIARTYKYIINRKKDPFQLNRAYYLHGDLNLELMNQAALIIKEYSDFSSFSKSNTQVKTNICNVMYVEWKRENDLLIFTIRADRFLRNMVRAIVGTLIEVGQGKITLEELRKIIKNKTRSDAGFSVPACGLYLTKIEYKKGLIDHE